MIILGSRSTISLNLEQLLLIDEGDIGIFLSVEIKYFEDGSFDLSQPHLISREFFISFDRTRTMRGKAVQT